MQCLGPAQVSHTKANMYMKGSALGGVQVIQQFALPDLGLALTVPSHPVTKHKTRMQASGYTSFNLYHVTAPLNILRADLSRFSQRRQRCCMLRW
jgi:hypothetical protein